MGAVTFSIDAGLVEQLKGALPLKLFVETGTFKGDAIAAMEPLFDQLVTIELSEPLWKDAVTRFAHASDVEVLHGDSPKTLADIRHRFIDTPTLFWLDAHWCVAENTAGESSQCPLVSELAAIGTLSPLSVILIDDARLFLAPPPAPHEASNWPSFSQIVASLRALSDAHEIMVINDVIVFYPAPARKCLTQFARSKGIDWQQAAQSLQENTLLRSHETAKEQVIREQTIAINAFKQALEAKERTITEQFKALKEFNESLTAKEQVIAEQSRAVSAFKQALDARQQAIEQHSVAFNTLKQALEAKEHVIQEQSKALQTYGLYMKGQSILRIPERLYKRTKAIFRPRLGTLYQYDPRPLTIPQPFMSQGTANHHPKVSIVTPSYNQGRFIERTLLSVLSQDYPNLEYFVQDGGSTDETIDVLNKYEDRLAGWASEKDNGQSHAINLGFGQCTGEIMAWLNSDDLLLPGTLTCIVDYFSRHPDVDVVYGNRLLIDESDAEIGNWILPGHDGDVLSWADYIPQETLFWRRQIWHKVGGQVDESFKFAMDWDLLIRFRAAGAKFAHIPRFLGAFRIHETQKTSAAISDLGQKEMNLIRCRTLGAVPDHKKIRRALLPFMLKHIIVDMAYRTNIASR